MLSCLFCAGDATGSLLSFAAGKISVTYKLEALDSPHICMKDFTTQSQ